jgi:hypothetical protein
VIKFILLFLFSFSAFGTVVSHDRVIDICEKAGYEDCRLVSAIVKQESMYKSGARLADSSGLMQLRCSTAKYMGLKDCARLYVPDTNIKYGIKYLKYIKNKLKTTNIRDILSSYNGGFQYKNGQFYPRTKRNGEYINTKYVNAVVCNYVNKGGILYWLSTEDYFNYKCYKI